MTQNVPYNQNPELVAMRDDIANRNYSIMIKEGLIIGACTLGGAAIGAMGIPMLTVAKESAEAFGAMCGGIGGLYGGVAVAEIATTKDRVKLNVDNEMLESYMSGKNYWGEGYREEVAEKGYGFGQVPPNTPALAQKNQARGAAA